MIKIRRALISVTDKDNILEFSHFLLKNGVEIISTGGTYKYLTENGIPVVKISELTDFPEILDGRVKTLHPRIHGGILADRRLESHIKEMNEHCIKAIDMVVVNLYQFEKAIEKEDIAINEAIEQIDIGGPTMIRAAAKNFHNVVVITSKTQYEDIMKELKENDFTVSYEKRLYLAKEAFKMIADYDIAIANYFIKVEEKKNSLPSKIYINYDKIEDLRYGENQHQAAGFYSMSNENNYIKLHGKELSYNNYLDISAAIELISEFIEPTCAILKHTNPCGIASASDINKAYELAIKCDPTSAFGGIIIFNREVNQFLASQLNSFFNEVVIAPSYDELALNLLKKKKDRRIIINKFNNSKNKYNIKSIVNGVLVQHIDDKLFNTEDFKTVTEHKISQEYIEDLIFSWKVVKHVKSNAIVIAKNKMVLGIGAGQMSRIDSVKLAIMKAEKEGFELAGAVLASDAFFPFADSIEELSKYKIKAVIQPGGSVRDDEVIDAANKHNIGMIFTGMRHFKH